MTPAPTLATRLEGPPVEQQVAHDMVRRSLPAIPVVVGVCGLVWGWAGALSSTYAVALVLANFVVAAALLAWTARISLALMMATALFGFAIRFAIVSLAVYLVRDQWWVAVVPLGLTLVVAHLGLLVWETRHVSASLAFPSLKPSSHQARRQG